MKRKAIIEVKTPRDQTLTDLSFSVQKNLAVVSHHSQDLLRAAASVWAVPHLRSVGVNTAVVPGDAVKVLNCAGDEVFQLLERDLQNLQTLSFKANSKPVSDLLAIQHFEIDDTLIALMLSQLILKQDFSLISDVLGVGEGDIRVTNCVFSLKRFETDDLLTGETIWFG